MDVQQIRNVVAEWAKSQRPIRAVWLVGSRARGTERPNSDVDLSIAMRWPTDYGDDYRLGMGWQDDLGVMLRHEVHVLTCRQAVTTMWQDAKDCRVLLYWRSPGLVLGAGPDPVGTT